MVDWCTAGSIAPGVQRGSGLQNSPEPRARQEPGGGWRWTICAEAWLTASPGSEARDAAGGVPPAPALANATATRVAPAADRIANALHLGIAIAALGVAAPSALAVFPYYGDGTAGEPASWKLEPGHTPTNVGDPWKLAATPADPNVQKVPGEKLTIEQNNSQQDELCGVTVMSLSEPHATMPSGTASCIAPGTPPPAGLNGTVGQAHVWTGGAHPGTQREHDGHHRQPPTTGAH